MAYSRDGREAARLADQAATVRCAEVDLLRRLVRTPVHSILDVGCGEGHFGDTLLDAFPGAVVDGVEPSRSAVSAARQRVRGGRPLFRTVSRGSVPDPIDPPGVRDDYDLVISRAVMRHHPDPKSFVGWIVARARAGGTVALADADDDTLIFHPPHHLIDGALSQARRDIPLLTNNPEACRSGRSVRRRLASAGCVDLRDDALVLLSHGDGATFAGLVWPVLKRGCLRRDAAGKPTPLGDDDHGLDEPRWRAVLDDIGAWADEPGAFGTWTLFYAAGVRG